MTSSYQKISQLTQSRQKAVQVAMKLPQSMHIINYLRAAKGTDRKIERHFPSPAKAIKFDTEILRLERVGGSKESQEILEEQQTASSQKHLGRLFRHLWQESIILHAVQLAGLWSGESLVCDSVWSIRRRLHKLHSLYK